MKIYVRLSGMEHQLCYAHGLHLAVCDVLFKKSVISNSSGSECNASDSQNSDENNSEDDECEEIDFTTSVDLQSSQNNDFFKFTRR